MSIMQPPSLSAVLIATGYSIAIFWLGGTVPQEMPGAGLHPIVVWIAALLGTAGFAQNRNFTLLHSDYGFDAQQGTCKCGCR